MGARPALMPALTPMMNRPIMSRTYVPADLAVPSKMEATRTSTLFRSRPGFLEDE